MLAQISTQKCCIELAQVAIGGPTMDDYPLLPYYSSSVESIRAGDYQAFLPHIVDNSHSVFILRSRTYGEGL